MPERLEPKMSPRSVYDSVKRYFYPNYNNPDGVFAKHLASVNNKDAITDNRLFDRHVAVGMIRKSAEAAGDPCFEGVSDGKIYECVVHIITKEHPEIGLKHRREEYRRLTQTPRQAAA
jgi:hypothetical protein